MRNGNFSWRRWRREGMLLSSKHREVKDCMCATLYCTIMSEIIAAWCLRTQRLCSRVSSRPSDYSTRCGTLSLFTIQIPRRHNVKNDSLFECPTSLMFNAMHRLNFISRSIALCLPLFSKNVPSFVSTRTVPPSAVTSAFYI